MTPSLYQYLNDEYSSPAKKPSANAVTSGWVKIDGRKAADCSTDFCTVAIRTTDENTISLEMDHVPLGEEVEQFVSDHDGEITKSGDRAAIRIKLTVKDTPIVRNLAKAIRRQAGRGAHYTNPNWKWVCPRTADTLERLAKHLVAFGRAKQSATRDNHDEILA